MNWTHAFVVEAIRLALNVDRRTFLGVGGVVAGAIVAGLAWDLSRGGESGDSVPDVRQPVSTEPKYGGVDGYIANRLGLFSGIVGAVGSGSRDTLRESKVAVRVQHAFVDSNVCGDDVNWETFYDQRLQMESMVFQYETWSEILCYGDESDPLGALLFDPSPLSNLGGRVADVVLAADCDFAMLVDRDAYESDLDSGIITFRVADIPYGLLRCCVLHVVDDPAVAMRSSVWVTVDNHSSVEVAQSGYVEVDTFCDDFVVPLVSSEDVASVEVAAFVSGIGSPCPFCDLGDDGCLRVAMHGAVMSELRVVVSDAAGSVAPLGTRIAKALSTSRMQYIYPNCVMPNSPEIASTLERAVNNRTIYSYAGRYTNLVVNLFTAPPNSGPSGYSYAANSWGDYLKTYYDELCSPKYVEAWRNNGDPDYPYSNDWFSIASNASLIQYMTALEDTWAGVLRMVSAGDYGAWGTTHGFSLPSDSRSDLGNHGLFDRAWWSHLSPLHADHGGWVGLAAGCMHALTRARPSISVSGGRQGNVGVVTCDIYYRVVEAKPYAEEPYVVFCFYAVNATATEPDSSEGQAAHSFLKVRLQSMSGSLTLEKGVSL